MSLSRTAWYVQTAATGPQHPREAVSLSLALELLVAGLRWSRPRRPIRVARRGVDDGCVRSDLTGHVPAAGG
ncbi:MAG TPA: hypothetical protein VI248_21610 [Kineosporiaceae bacterium]